MTNFIFKSQKDLQKISQQLITILKEQVHQRSDLQEIKYMLHKLQTNKDLQKTVDEFYSGKSSQSSDDDLDDTV